VKLRYVPRTDRFLSALSQERANNRVVRDILERGVQGRIQILDQASLRNSQLSIPKYERESRKEFAIFPGRA
jgi:hypothetical protein